MGRTQIAGLSLALLSLFTSPAHAAVVAPPMRALSVSPFLTVHVGAQVFDVLDYGAKGDGSSNDTVAVQKALDACGQASGGGTVLFPDRHVFMVSCLQIRGSHVHLDIEGNAVLRFLNDRSRWPSSCKGALVATGVSDIAITGGGVVDGQGAAWWPHASDFRPNMLQFNKVDGLLISNVTFLNSPNHNLELYTSRTEIAYVNIFAPSSRAPTPSHNTDGIDVHGSPFYIHHCNITTGDDNVAVHAGDLLVENCFFGSGHGASIGSVCSDVVRNVTFRNIIFDGGSNKYQEAAVRIKTDKGCSGSVTQVTYDSLTVRNTRTTIDITMFYQDKFHHDLPHRHRDPGLGARAGDVTIRDITISNIEATNSDAPGHFLCVADTPCTQITLAHVHHTSTPGAFDCSYAHGTATDVSPNSCLLP